MSAWDGSRRGYSSEVLIMYSKWVFCVVLAKSLAQSFIFCGPF